MCKGLLVNKVAKDLAADASVNIVDRKFGTLQIAVNTGVTQDKLTATSDTTTSKAVLASKTIRSVGVDDTMDIGLSGNVINLAVDKTKIQEKLTSRSRAH